MAAASVPSDPRTAYPQPPFKKQQQLDLPGLTKQMHPQPDHGEKSYQGADRLRGMVALITGGDSGIGRAVALAYAREGAHVAINYLNEDDDAKTTQGLVEEAGVQAFVQRGDLRDADFCESLVVDVYEQFERLDVLVNNAAYQETHEEIDDFSPDLFDRIMKTNLYAPFLLSRAALSRMTPGGSIINTASIQGYRPSPELLPYAASKSALLGLTKGLAKLAMNQGVRVNAVAPGPVWTPLIPASIELEKAQQFGANTLFGRPAQPAELAPLYVWLASAQASYVTGEVFGATGGSTPL